MAAYLPVSGMPSKNQCHRHSELQKAADVLNAGKKVAMLIGAGSLGAANEVKEIAELLGAGVAKALLGKAALPMTYPMLPALSVCWVPNPVGI